jgi:hypothetical protein
MENSVLKTDKIWIFSPGVAMKLRPFLVLVAILAFGPMRALACSCAHFGVPLCQTYWNNDAVFVGEVLTIETITVPMEAGRSTIQVERHVVRFKVSKMYRGDVGAETVVQTGMGGGDCGYHFEAGHTYLVFGNIYDGTIHTGICNLTQPVEQAEKALAWLDSLSTRSPDASIFGTVTRHTFKDQQYTNAPVAGVAVSLKDSAGHESATTTDAGGAYSFNGLKAGTYSVLATLPKGLTGGNEREHVKVHEQGCADASFWLSNDNQISGRVLDSGGKAVEGVMVALAQTDAPNFTVRQDYVSFDTFKRTDDRGHYGFEGLLPGSYLVFLNPFGVDDKNPYPRQFYGGGNDPLKATKITVGEAGEVEDIDFTLPPALARKDLHVEVRDAQGLAVQNAYVIARDQDTPSSVSSPSQRTASDGAATLEIYAGRSYYVTAVIGELGKQRCGGPVLVDPQKTGAVSITIEHPIGNCMAYLNPQFKGPR